MTPQIKHKAPVPVRSVKIRLTPEVKEGIEFLKSLMPTMNENDVLGVAFEGFLRKTYLEHVRKSDVQTGYEGY